MWHNARQRHVGTRPNGCPASVAETLAANSRRQTRNIDIRRETMLPVSTCTARDANLTKQSDVKRAP
eukprot:7579855-Pyramimonas_sp.AAC.1